MIEKKPFVYSVINEFKGIRFVWGMIFLNTLVSAQAAIDEAEIPYGEIKHIVGMLVVGFAFWKRSSEPQAMTLVYREE